MRTLISGWLALIWIGLALQATAQAPAANSSSDIYLKLKKLNVLGTVLYIAAHPDDENTRLLAYLAREKQYKTGYMSLTRGDGGQNLIGNEQGIELGLIRTQELLAARRIDGAEQFFSRAYDFGFSKNADEALKIWGHDKILSDVVWMIRYYQPDVIITRFPGDARAGHGHHWASALLANEAFKAAADSTRFPEQLRSLKPWQARRILWNTFNFGGLNTTTNDQLKVDVGVYNSVLGKGYGEIASESRSQHKSQGFGVARQRGQAFEYFATTGGEAPANDLMDGVNTGWSRVKGSEQIQPLVDHIIAGYNFAHPEYSLDSLVELYKRINRLPSNERWKWEKLQEVQDLIVQCSGIFAEATTDAAYVVQGQNMRVNFFINKRNDVPVTLKSIRMNDDLDTLVNENLPQNRNYTVSRVFPIAYTRQATQPYWLRKPMEQGSFNLQSQSEIASPENQPDFGATFILDIKDIELFIKRPVQCKYTDPVKGEVYQPVAVITPLVVSLTPSVALINVKPGNEHTSYPVVQLQYKSNFTASRVPVNITLRQDNSVIYAKDTLVNFETGQVYNEIIPLKKVFQQHIDPHISAVVQVKLDTANYKYAYYLRHIEYDHIPAINYFYKDNVKVVPDEIKTAGKKIGYITGAGDKVPQALEQMGYDVTLLQENDLTPDRLKQFDAVVVGVRAYNVHSFLENRYPVLMAFVQQGGNLIAQYNTNTQLGPLKSRMGPYPFALTARRVTNEKAAVKFLLPQHPVLNYPNKITQADFEGWIQERSIYQAEQLDAHYEAPLAMADDGEPESNGSLIIAPYGKGNFVYTGLVFFRELPAGVPGAYRLMANLIALPQHNNN
jgi:LmbE family N-acetylglucosaminyl deacetylase